MSTTVTTQIPDGWGEDKLSAFLDLAWHNVFASFNQAPEHYAKLLRIDSAFLLIW